MPLVLLLAAAVLRPMYPSADPDVWWHLRTGDFIRDTGAIPSVDPFSWTAAGREWVAHEWGSQVLISFFNEQGGPLLLRMLVGISIGLTAWISLRTIRRFTLDARVHTVVLLGVLVLSSPTWTVRPHIFSVPLFAFFIDTLIAFSRDEAGKRIWLLVPLTLLWANLHGVFVVGVGSMGLVAVVLWFKSRTKAKKLAAATGLATVVGAINPGWFGSYLYPFHVADVSTRISEWQPTTITEGFGFVFIGLVVVTPAIHAIRKLRPDPISGALSLVFALVGFYAFKNVWLAGLAMAPLLARALEGAFPRQTAPSARESKLLLGIAVLLIGAAALSTSATLLRSSEAELMSEDRFPSEAVRVLAEQPPGRVMNAYNFGGYLMWKEPDILVSMDGRNDMYGNEILNEHLVLQDLEDGWQDILDANRVQYVLWGADDPLSEALQLLPMKWKLLHEDEQAVLFSRLQTP